MIALEDDSISRDKEKSAAIYTEIYGAMYKVKTYTGEELALFKQHKASRHCVQLLQEVRAIFTDEFVEEIHSGKLRNEPKKTKKEKLSRYVKEIRKAEKKLISLQSDVEFLKRQKKKARRLAKPQILLTEKGCFHTTPASLTQVMANGLLSPEKMAAKFGSKSLGGHKKICVYDVYSYFRLGKVIFSQKKYNAKEEITLREISEAIKRNPNLNLANNHKENMNFLKMHPFALETIDRSLKIAPFLEGKKRDIFERLKEFSSSILIINETMEFFPGHDNHYLFEGHIVGEISPKKIMGIVFAKETESLIECKILGLPAYNRSGKLIWPL